MSTGRGAYTKVTLSNGYSEMFAGRLGKREAVDTLHQWNKRMLPGGSHVTPKTGDATGDLWRLVMAVKGSRTRNKAAKLRRKHLKRFLALRKRVWASPDNKSLSKALDCEHYAAEKLEKQISKSQDRAWAQIDRKR